MKNITIIIILLIIVGGGIFAWQYFGAPEEEVIIEDENDGRETYRNEEHGFEIKYPKDYFSGVDTKPETMNYLILGEAVNLLSSDSYNEINNNYIVDMSIDYSSLDAAAYKDKVDEYNEYFGYEVPGFKDITIDNQPAYSFQGTAINMRTVCVSEEALIPLQNNSIIIRIGKCSQEAEDLLTEEDKKIFNQMLSTFKFLD